MATYPSVNWWRGNLRHHESYLSFVARFAHLNGIKVTQAFEFLDALIGSRSHLSEAEVGRIAERIGEDERSVKTVVTEPLQLMPCPGSTITQPRMDGSLRYCEACAVVGYHSYLHEHRWLRCCPLHHTPLKILKVSTQTGSLLIRTAALLVQTMSAACPRWPAASEGFRPETFPCVVELTQWAHIASDKAAELSGSVVWSDRPVVFPDTPSAGKAIGQLHALYPIPATMHCVFEQFETDWIMDVQHLSTAARQAMAWLSVNGFHTTFAVYQRLAAYRESTHPVVVALDACRAALHARHAQCQCKWGRATLAFAEKWWFPTQPDTRPMSSLMCPNAVAHEQLECTFGRRSEYRSSLKHLRERADLYYMASDFIAQGVVKVMDEADVLQGDSEGLRRLEWVGNPGLNELCEAITCAQIRLMQQSLLGWLDSIDAGEHPDAYTSPWRGPHLCKTADTLDVIVWSRPDPSAGTARF